MIDKKLNKRIEDISIKEALAADAAELSIRRYIIMDPAPMPFIPVTPIVIGKKIVNVVKSFIQSDESVK